MSTMTISKNHSPDGMRGGAMDRRHDTGHDHRTSTRQSDKVETDHSHDHYDDGLVHDHSWHSTSNVR